MFGLDTRGQTTLEEPIAQHDLHLSVGFYWNHVHGTHGASISFCGGYIIYEHHETI